MKNEVSVIRRNFDSCKCVICSELIIQSGKIHLGKCICSRCLDEIKTIKRPVFSAVISA